MNKFLIIFLFNFLCIGSTFSQKKVKPNYDSLWYFYPFTIDLSAGAWTPAGRLSEYFNPSLQFGGGLGMMVSDKLWFQLWIMPRILNQKKPISISVNNSVIEYRENSVGACLGGWLSRTFHQDKIVSAEIVTGLTWEHIPTNIMKANKKDSLSIQGVGLSCGINSWINTLPGLNFGLKAIYTYSTYDLSRYLAGPVGGHSFTFSLVYRLTGRNREFRKWY